MPNALISLYDESYESSIKRVLPKGLEELPKMTNASYLTSSEPVNGYLYEITPDGKLSENHYSYFPRVQPDNFYADNSWTAH